MRSHVRFAFDLDATITREEILPRLAREFLAPEAADAFEAQTREGLSGKQDYLVGLTQRIEALAGIDIDQIHARVAQISLQDPLVRWIQLHADQCMVVTHNFATWIDPIAKKLGCEVYASTPKVNNGQVTGLSTPLDKAKVIADQVAKGHVVVAVGDGANDVSMLKASHWGIAWSGIKPAPPALLAVAQEEQSQVSTLCARLDELLRRSPHAFLSPALQGVYQAIATRRDIRSFLPDRKVDQTTKDRLLRAFFQAPNVGLMQPAVVLQIDERPTRKALHTIVDKERRQTAKAYTEQDGIDRGNDFLSLKVEGILDCAELWVVALRDRREGEIFGRRTMPQMDLASAACAIQNLWLAARAEGLGLGWVSIFDQAQVGALLGLPEGAQAIAILCIGPTQDFPALPKLARDGWRQPKEMHTMIFQDRWGQAPSFDKAPFESQGRAQKASAAEPKPHVELVLGGARSGKSEYAEQLAMRSAKQRIYVATAKIESLEMAQRIELHQQRRDARWKTEEVHTDLAQALAQHCQPGNFVLVDCLTLWLSNCMHQDCWPQERERLLSVLPQLSGDLCLVSNQVGQGVVPMGKLSRDFVDESGRLHQAIAARASHVTMVVAGLPQILKAPRKV